MTNPSLFSMILVCPHGLEPLCKAEALAHGGQSPKETPGRVEFTAPLSAAYRLCLSSRYASRLLLVLARFTAGDRDSFYRQAAELPWEQEIPEGSTLSVDCTLHSLRNTQLTHSLFAARLLKDAICDRMRLKTGKRPSVETKLPDLRFSLSVYQTQCTLALDFSGETLNKRGYRKAATGAPLKENLAAAMLTRGNWEEAFARGCPFLDPMCGSGTLVIEAAYMAAGIPSQINRSFFGFLRWQRHNAALWQTLSAEAKRLFPQQLQRLQGHIFHAVDCDEAACKAAALNIEAAGLTPYIHLHHADIFNLDPARLGVGVPAAFSPAGLTPSAEKAKPNMPAEPRSQEALPGARAPEETPEPAATLQAGTPEAAAVPKRPSPAGFIAVNPPYGERMGDLRAVEDLYRRIGTEFPQRFPLWKMVMLSGSKALSLSTGLSPYKTNPFKNGPIDSLLACYDFADAQNPNRLKNEQKEQEIREMFLNRLKKNRRQLKAWLQRTRTTCYRLYDADIPEFAAAIDLYQTEEAGLHCVIAEYAPPPTLPQQRRNRNLNLLTQATRDFLSIPPESIHLKVRKKQKGKSQYEKSRNHFQLYTVAEGGLRFRVDFDRYLDTGLFLDHRLVRMFIREQIHQFRAAAPNRPVRFLNLFAYTCTASVYAADAGAQTVSVDLSDTYLKWGKANFALNSLPDPPQPHRFFREDSRLFLSNETRCFDFIYIDPPTFSNSKRTSADFSVETDYVSLIQSAAKCLTQRGVILFSNHFKRFQMNTDLFPDFDIENRTQASLDVDFERNRTIHQAWLFKRRMAAAPGKSR